MGLRTQGHSHKVPESASIKDGTPNNDLDIPPDLDLPHVSPVINQKNQTRQKARSLLVQLQSEVIPAIRNSTFPIWAPEAASEIETAYLKASLPCGFKFYSRQQLPEALVVGRQKLQDFDQSFLDALQNHALAYTRTIIRLLRAISAVLALKPKHPDALHLKIR